VTASPLGARDTTSAAHPAPARELPGRRGLRAVRERLSEFLFVVPITLVIGLTIGIPTVSAIYHSFTNWQPGSSSPWSGFANYTALFREPGFTAAAHNQLYLLLGLPAWILLPLGLAVLLHGGVRGAALVRAIIFFPATVSPALIGILFTFILAPFGPLNNGLHTVHLGFLAHQWLSDTTIVKPVLIAVMTWATIGIGVVIFSAALDAVPQEVLEAAELDGAGWSRRLVRIIMPALRPVIEMWSTIMVMVAFVGMFPWVFILTKGGPGFSSTTLDFDIYTRALTDGDFGAAAAEMVTLLLVVAVVIILGRVALRLIGRGAR
jgi:ABC-type sugar transport system permease subunit